MAKRFLADVQPLVAMTNKCIQWKKVSNIPRFYYSALIQNFKADCFWFLFLVPEPAWYVGCGWNNLWKWKGNSKLLSSKVRSRNLREAVGIEGKVIVVVVTTDAVVSGGGTVVIGWAVVIFSPHISDPAVTHRNEGASNFMPSGHGGIKTL